MTILYNRQDKKELRAKLRKAMTKAEVILWTALKGGVSGVKFRRQASIGPFIVDFYCPELKLVPEVDGPTHFETQEVEAYDSERSEFLESKGIIILRCTNMDVYDNLPGVVDAILHAIAQMRERTTSARGVYPE